VVAPAGGDVLQFYKAGLMEIPDLLVVSKSDLGELALRTRRDLEAALRSLGSPHTPVLSVSALPPPHGVEELLAALDDHRGSTSLRSRRVRARRASALAEYAHEHGELGLRALGGRAAAERLLARQDPALDPAALLTALERAADAGARAR
jgi:LAO/AO transport system kinase